MWPTPDATRRGTAKDPTAKKRPSGAKKQMTLNDAVKMWPTPRAQDGSKMGTGSLGDKKVLYPTPTTPHPHDNEKTVGKYMSSQNQKDLTYAVARSGGQLNADWVSILMGLPADWTIVSDGSAESQEQPADKPTE